MSLIASAFSMTDVIRRLLSHGGVEERISGLYIAVRSLRQMHAQKGSKESSKEAQVYLNLVPPQFLARMLISSPLAANVAEDFLEVVFLCSHACAPLAAESPVVVTLLKKAMQLTVSTKAQTLLHLYLKQATPNDAVFVLEHCLLRSRVGERQGSQGERTVKNEPIYNMDHVGFVLTVALEAASMGSSHAPLVLAPPAAHQLRDMFVGSLHRGGQGAGATMHAGSANEAHDTALLALEACLRGLAPEWTTACARGEEESGEEMGRKESDAFVIFLSTTMQVEVEVLMADAVDMLLGEDIVAGSDGKNVKPCPKRVIMLWNAALGMVDSFLALMLGGDGECESESSSNGDEEAGGSWSLLPGAVLLGVQRSLYRALDSCVELMNSFRTHAAGTHVQDQARIAMIKDMLTRAQVSFKVLAREDPSVASRVKALQLLP